MQDTYGQNIESTYLVLGDPTFERRLKQFDPRLKLMFDQNLKRWVVLEEAYDGSGWNCIIKCQNPDKSPRPVGDWVFEKLHKYRQVYEFKVRQGIDNWLHGLRRELEYQQQIESEKASREHQDMLRDDLTQWRKASKELQGMPANDATAGYRKVNYENV